MPSAERAQQGQAGCPEHGRRKNFFLGQRAVEYNVGGWLHGREQKPAAEESSQADPVSRSKSAQKRQHKRAVEDNSACCLMHASLKQSPHGASSGSPYNVLHSLVYIYIYMLYIRNMKPYKNVNLKNIGAAAKKLFRVLARL